MGRPAVVSRVFRQSAALAAVAAATCIMQGARAQTTPAGPPSPAAGAAAARTQTPPQNGIQDIVVTAQRRSEAVQKTPLAVTALNASSLLGRSQTSIADISSSVPNVNFTQVTARARVTVRGIGLDTVSLGSDSAVALNVDGVYYSRSGAAMAGFYDVDRIEVLRGPQGTLYGRNATGGSVNIITKRPGDTPDGYVQGTMGNYGTLNFEGALGGPVNDGVSARLSFQTFHNDGYGTNLVTGHRIDNKDSQAVRGQIALKPTDRLTIRLEGDYYHEKDRANAYHYLGAGVESAPGVGKPSFGLLLPGGFEPSNPVRDIATPLDPNNKTSFYGGYVDATYELNDTMSLHSITAYRRSNINTEYDIQPVGATLVTISFQKEFSKQLTQEFQFNWDTDRNKLVAGAYYLHETLYGANISALNIPLGARPIVIGAGPDDVGPGGAFLQGVFLGGNLKTDALAGYAQDTFNLTSRLHLTAGARYSYEKKTVHDQDSVVFSQAYVPDYAVTSPFRDDSAAFHSFTPKLGIDYDLARDVLLYASWSKGFKSGNFNLGTFPQAGAPGILKPEKVTAYEGGIKSTLFDRRLRANISGFYYDYTDLQVSKVIGFSLALVNAATARIYGAEGEFALQPLADRHFQMTLNASWLHARYRNFISSDPNRPGQGDTTDPSANNALAFNLAGNHLAQAPDYTVNLGAEYTFDTSLGSFTVRGDSTWTGRVYFSPFNLAYISQAPTNVQNAYLNYESASKHFYANVYIKNIGNKNILSSSNASSSAVGGGVIGYAQPPRTIGVTLGVHL